MIYAALGLSKVHFIVPARAEVWLSPLIGIATGVVSGATGIFALPAVPYLQSLGLDKDELVQALGLSFTVSTAALAVALMDGGVLHIAEMKISLLALVAALIGMGFGQIVRGRDTARNLPLLLSDRAAVAGRPPRVAQRLLAVSSALPAFICVQIIAHGQGEDAMPHITARDGVRLYYEEAGEGTAVVFVHEYAGDYRTWEPQMRYFSRSHRCVTYSQRGYPPSDMPEDPARYGQDIARDDVIALMDALKIDKAHVVGHSMGGYTALHVGINFPNRCLSVVAAGCGWGSTPDPELRASLMAFAADAARMFAEEGIVAAAAKYAEAHGRLPQKYKDPRGHAEFARMLAEHSAEGHALTMLNLQIKRPTLWDMQDALKRFSVPLLVIVGDEDEMCIDGSVFLKRTAPTAGLLVIPRSGHNIPAEEPAAFNAACAELFASAEAGRWLAHRPNARSEPDGKAALIGR